MGTIAENTTGWVGDIIAVPRGSVAPELSDNWFRATFDRSDGTLDYYKIELLKPLDYDAGSWARFEFYRISIGPDVLLASIDGGALKEYNKSWTFDVRVTDVPETPPAFSRIVLPDGVFRSAVEFSPDGTKIYFEKRPPTANRDVLYEHNLVTGVSRQLLEGSHTQLLISPDGRLLDLALGSTSIFADAIDLTTGRTFLIAEDVERLAEARSLSLNVDEFAALPGGRFWILGTYSTRERDLNGQFKFSNFDGAFVWDPASGSLTQTFSAPVPANRPARELPYVYDVSTDGNTILLRTGDGWYVTDLAYNLRRLPVSRAEFPSQMSADGARVIFHEQGVRQGVSIVGQAFLVDVAGGTRSSLSDLYADLPLGSSISPDGRYAAYVSWNYSDSRHDTARIVVVDLSSGQRTFIPLGESVGGSLGTFALQSFSPDGRTIYLVSPAALSVSDTNNAADLYSVPNPLAGPQGPAIFTEGGDTVDFGNLTATQRDAIAGGANVHNGLGGDDNVAFPASAAGYAAAGLSSPAFDGQVGADTIRGGGGADQISGGAGNDSLIASAGADRLVGDDGADSFSFSADLFRSLPANTVQTILGGAGLDTLILPGSPSDYTFAVAYTPRGAPSADATVTSLTHAAAAGQATISASGVEKALFQGGITNAVRLTDDSVTVEMLRLADEVYGPSETLRHRAEPLAYAGEGPVQYVGSHAGDRLWHRLEAIELGMPAADYNSFETLRFSLVKGFYQAYVGGESFLGDTAEANALVLSGLVDGKQTLAIAFRGTDQPADFADYDSFARHFAKYQPLISAVKTYLDANPNITQVLLSGHSLGAGVVEHAYKALEAWDTQNGHTMAAFTDGSPGSEVATPGYLGVTFENTDDLVPLLGQVSQAANVLTRPALALALHKIGGPFLSLDDQLTITDRVLALQPKDVQGALVRITAGEPAFFRDFDEHDASLYVRELRKILSFAKDPDSPFSSSAFGQALRNNSFYAGPDLQISIGASRFPATDRSDYGLNTRYNAEFASSVTLEAGDNWALGNAVSADFFLFAGTPQDIARGRPTIDGGTGRDTLVLNGTGQDWSWNQSTGALNHAGSQVATLSRIEQVFLSSGEVLGSVANVQRPGGNAVAAFIEPGAPAAAAAGFVLQAGFDYADAGDGSFDVLGTAEADRLFVGRGDKAIDTGGGDDLIIVKASATGDRIRIDGGQGADVIFGGRGIETYVVDSAGDRVVVAAPDGMHTVVASVSFALPDNVQNLVLQSGATRGGGNALDNAITGSDGRNLLEGVEGQDTLQGAGGDDTIFGGAGSDSLTGDGGSDYVRGEDGDDRLTGGDAFDDLHGNMGNDTVSGEAGGDWVVGGKDNDLLSGGDGDDLVYGNLGADTCEGGPGADIVRGGQQDDILRGGDGNDILFGDRDADTISGEAGADIFSTHGDAGLDRVLDFRIAEGDRVQLLPGTKYTLAQVGADTVISMTGGGQMVLVDVQVSTLTGNWIFGA